jgi:CBS domain-containing protein
MTVKSMIDLDTHPLACGAQDLTLKQAIERMVDMHVNALAILSHDQSLAGIITDHDVMRALYKNSGQLEDSIVGDWMSPHVKTCSVSTKLAEAMKQMGRHKIRHLVVEEDGKPLAIIGIRALLAKIHEIDEMEINVLRDIAVARSA